MLSFSEQAIKSSLKKHNMTTNGLPIEPSALETEYTLAEAIDVTNVSSLDNTDIVIVLSGRSGFSGTYLEATDKYVLCENEYDSTNTLRRMSYGINIAKQCTQKNLENGITKLVVYVYFNGCKKHNDELREILRTEGGLNGYPAELFIIDSIPFENTLGQVLGLSRFLDEYWPYFCKMQHIDRSANFVFCTSSYHVPRVALAHGAIFVQGNIR